MYYIYALIDVRTNLPFYIGKGKTLNNRHLDHFKETNLVNENRHKVFKINYLKKNGYDIPVDILIDDIKDEQVAYSIEIEYIKKYGRMNIDTNGILTNILIDSRSPPSWKGKRQSEEHKNKRFESRTKTVAERGIPSRSIESRKRLSENSKGDKNHFYGKTHSEEFSIQQSARMQGNQFNSQEYIFTSACGTKYQVMGFAKFCREHNLTVSPLEKGMYTGHWPKSGKSAGWQVEKVITNIKE